MSMQDPISDMLTRIRNAGMAALPEVSLPASRIKQDIAETLKKEGYISGCRSEGEGIDKKLVLTLKYYKRKPVIEGLKRVSKPSCRIYCGSRDIPRVRNGLGTVVLSTPEGVLSGRSASEKKLGGEVLCYVW